MSGEHAGIEQITEEKGPHYEPFGADSMAEAVEKARPFTLEATWRTCAAPT